MKTLRRDQSNLLQDDYWPDVYPVPCGPNGYTPMIYCIIGVYSYININSDSHTACSLHFFHIKNILSINPTKLTF